MTQALTHAPECLKHLIKKVFIMFEIEFIAAQSGTRLISTHSTQSESQRKEALTPILAKQWPAFKHKKYGILYKD
jgi:hypothetical protein